MPFSEALGLRVEDLGSGVRVGRVVTLWLNRANAT